MEVVVAEGAVSLSAPDVSSAASGAARAIDSLLLGVADLGRIDAKGQLRKLRGVNVREMLAWTRGELVFNNTPVNEVIARLNMWYDARIVLADSSLATVGFTSSFGSEPLDGVLRELAAAVGARLENHNGEFILRRDQ
jgi:transmembrane sensor